MKTFKFEKLSRTAMKSIGGGTKSQQGIYSITVRCSGDREATLTSSTATIAEARDYGNAYCGAGNYKIVCVGDC